MLDQILSRVREENRLFSVLFELTYKCNLDCFFCYNERGLQGEPLAVADYKRVFGELRELDVLFLSLSGGEPLAYPHFFELGREARDLGFSVKIKTNGHIVYGRTLERIVEEVDPFNLEISLHGARAETHDRQTRLKGSFDRLMRNLVGLKDAGMRVQLNSTLTRWNENEMEAMFEIADELGFDLQVTPQVSPRDDGDETPLSVSPSREGVRHLMQIQRERSSRKCAARPAGEKESGGTKEKAASEKLCGTGSSTLTVDPVGNVYPCVQWRKRLGNLHSASIRDIWEGSEALGEVRALNRDAAKMVAALGPQGGACGFCQGLAALHGDPLKLYPSAETQLSAAKKLRET